MQALFGRPKPDHYGVNYWDNPERSGWLMKQGDILPNWRRRWFVLKNGKIFWFLNDVVTPESSPRGVIEVAKCLSIKGAEDTINRSHAFEISTQTDNMYFIADSDKEKEDWINAVGRAIVRCSRSMMEQEHSDYTTSS